MSQFQLTIIAVWFPGVVDRDSASVLDRSMPTARPRACLRRGQRAEPVDRDARQDDQVADPRGPRLEVDEVEHQEDRPRPM